MVVRRWFPFAALLMAVVLLAGCATSDGDRPFPENAKKAAQFNALLGSQYMRAGNLKRARLKLRRALREDSDNVDAHATFALLEMRLDRPDEARKHFEKALDLEPDDPSLHNNYGTFLCSQKQYDEGIQQFLKAARNKLYDRPAYAYANAGQCARQAGQIERARGYLDSALARDRRLPSALYEYADLELHADRPQRAQKYYKRYNEVAEAGPHSLWLGIRIARELGDRAAARSDGLQLLKRFPESPQAKRFLKTR